MEIPQTVKDAVKETVGYNECGNKGAFLIGANVAFRKAESFYQREIETLTVQRDGYKMSFENVNSDMKLLTSIIEKHTES